MSQYEATICGHCKGPMSFGKHHDCSENCKGCAEMRDELEARVIDGLTEPLPPKPTESDDEQRITGIYDESLAKKQPRPSRIEQLESIVSEMSKIEIEEMIPLRQLDDLIRRCRELQAPERT